MTDLTELVGLTAAEFEALGLPDPWVYDVPADLNGAVAGRRRGSDILAQDLEPVTIAPGEYVQDKLLIGWDTDTGGIGGGLVLSESPTLLLAPERGDRRWANFVAVGVNQYGRASAFSAGGFNGPGSLVLLSEPRRRRQARFSYIRLSWLAANQFRFERSDDGETWEQVRDDLAVTLTPTYMGGFVQGIPGLSSGRGRVQLLERTTGAVA
jgi:hypothetical protein